MKMLACSIHFHFRYGTMADSGAAREVTATADAVETAAHTSKVKFLPTCEKTEAGKWRRLRSRAETSQVSLFPPFSCRFLRSGLMEV